MKTILIFYDSDQADLKLATEVAEVIRSIGFEPWLADNNVKHNWRTEVERIAGSNACAGAVAIWTENSRKNIIVCDEATLVSKLNLPLLGVLVNSVRSAPLGLTEGPRLRYDTSDRQASNKGLEERISSVFGVDKSDLRILKLGAKSLAAPGMVLSVSSFETQIEPEESLKLLNIAQPPAVLVSAYDLLRPEFQRNSPGRIKSKPKIHDKKALLQLRDNGSVLFLDSGNYEAMRYRDSNWGLGKKRILEAQNMIGADLVFTHDKLPEAASFEKASAVERIGEISSEFERDVKLVDCAVAPIVHAPRLPGNGYCHDLLPEICCGVVRAVSPKMIAVAERELGDGLLKRIETIAKIRKALSKQDTRTFLHVLGTGNPISTAFLSMAGADFFDGLEWCRTAIDGKRWRLYHFQQWDLLKAQTPLIRSADMARIINSERSEIKWVTKVALHNLAFFLQADETIREHHRLNEYEQLFSILLDLDEQYKAAKKVVVDT